MRLVRLVVVLVAALAMLSSAAAAPWRLASTLALTDTNADGTLEGWPRGSDPLIDTAAGDDDRPGSDAGHGATFWVPCAAWVVRSPAGTTRRVAPAQRTAFDANRTRGSPA